MTSATIKHVRGFNHPASGIKSVQETLGNRLKELEDEIKADEAGKQGFERLLFQLGERKIELEKRIEGNLRWTGGAETDLGPFEQLYGTKTKEIASIYSDAKARHREGIRALIKGFAYHPEYFRPQDSFHATPFVPK